MTKQPNGGADERDELIAKARRFIDAGPIPGIATPRTPQWMADFALAVLRDREADAVRAAFEKVKARLDGLPSGREYFAGEIEDEMDAVLREYEGGESENE